MLEQILDYGALFCGLAILGCVSLALVGEGLAEIVRDLRDQWRGGGR